MAVLDSGYVVDQVIVTAMSVVLLVLSVLQTYCERLVLLCVCVIVCVGGCVCA